MSELPFESPAVVSSEPNSTVEEIPAKFPAEFSVEDYEERPPLPEPQVFTLGTQSEQGSDFSLADVSGVCLPGYHLGPHQPARSAESPPVECPLYKVGELDYLAVSPPEPGPTTAASDPGAEPDLSEACKVPVYEVSDPRLDLTTGQVHIHIVTSEPSGDQCEVLNLSSDLSVPEQGLTLSDPGQKPSDPNLL